METASVMVRWGGMASGRDPGPHGGWRRHLGTHPAGVLVAPSLCHLDGLVPLKRLRCAPAHL